jgi:crotonobetainyl-CoA:carnitine CoA-transferase CaiB-like acyl-CoA transferase
MSALSALHGFRVLDLSRVLAGPLSAQIFADLGADVIKVERPIRGDDTYEWAPSTMVRSPETVINESVYFCSCNRGKRSVTADLTDAMKRQLVVRLVEQADVFIENYKAGTLAMDQISKRCMRSTRG